MKEQIKKRAIVVIHGIGEQRPMDTIRNFVRTVWKQNKHIDNPHFWSKPSSVSDSFEQRCLTTNLPASDSSSSNKQKIDFYEYYWAQYTSGSQFKTVRAWLLNLIIRSPKAYYKYAKTLLPIWLLLCTFLVIATYLVVIYFDKATSSCNIATISISDITFSAIKCLDNFSWSPLILIIAVAILTTASGYITRYLGDVARYVQATPDNIETRRKIRKGGVKLLTNLVESNEYDNITLVGHSLGSIIAYDILTQLWSLQYSKKDNKALSCQALKLIKQLEHFAQQMFDINDGRQHLADDEREQLVASYRATQADLFTQLQHDDSQNKASQPWIISELITLGSPLTYADFLLFKQQKNFVLRKLDREFPTSPPVSGNNKNYSMTFASHDKTILHHGAVFAPVRWTNISSPHYCLLWGDIISGPVNKSFYPPKSPESTVEEVKVSPILEIKVHGDKPRACSWFNRFFTHTNYWYWSEKYTDDTHFPPEHHITQLRKALKLSSKITK